MKKVLKPLNEAINDVKKLVWPTLSTLDVIKIMRYSPNWNPSLEQAEAEVQLTPLEYLNVTTALEKCDDIFDVEFVKKLYKIKPANNEQILDTILVFSGDKQFLDNLMFS